MNGLGHKETGSWELCKRTAGVQEALAGRGHSSSCQARTQAGGAREAVIHRRNRPPPDPPKGSSQTDVSWHNQAKPGRGWGFCSVLARPGPTPQEAGGQSLPAPSLQKSKSKGSCWASMDLLAPGQAEVTSLQDTGRQLLPEQKETVS